MSMFIEIPLDGSTFVLEVNLSDTMLEVKQKIEKFLQDDLGIAKLQRYRLQLIFSPDRNPSHNEALRTEQLPPPSNPTEEMIIDGHQESSVTIVQTEQLPPPSNPTEKIIDGHQESSVTTTFETEQLAPLLNLPERIIEGHQDSNLTTVQAEQTPTFSPEREIVVYVSRSPGGNERVAVTVSTSDKVNELRRKLAKIIQEGGCELRLPQEAYYFQYKKRLMNENQTFRLTGVKDYDSINIIPKRLTPGKYSITF